MPENKKNNVASHVLTGLSIASAGVGLTVGVFQLVGMISSYRAMRKAAKAEQEALENNTAE